MSVTIDHETLAVESLGLNTVGQVLTHVSRGNRLVVNLLIDGQQPDLALITQIRQSKLIKSSLEDRDYVTLCDILTYDTSTTTANWREALMAMHRAIKGDN